MTEQTLDMEAAYSKYRPHLFGALAQLARRGFVVSPSDGLDLIHDFFAEAWDGIRERFDRDKGDFDGYVYGAFVHFARPRIVTLNRLQRSLVEPEWLDYLPAEDNYDEAYLPPENLEQLASEAILNLRPRDREILNRYLSSGPRSESKLAKKLSLTPYRLKMALADVLGQVTVMLHKPEHIPQRDWMVAVALWRDRRTVEQAAGYLGVTVHHVKEANSRNVSFLTQALKHYHPKGRTHVRRDAMKPQKYLIPPHDLLEDVLRSTGNQELLAQVRQRADEILFALENSESFGLSEEEMREIDPLWVAEVYRAVSGVLDAAEETPEARALFRAHAEEEASIGYAFREALMPDLPGHLREIGRWLRSAPRVDEEEVRELLNEPSARAATPTYSEQMAPYGVTPLTVFYAVEAVSSLLDRVIRYGIVERGAVVFLDHKFASTTVREGDGLGSEMLVDEVSKVAECSVEAARALYSWAILVAQYKPFLFDGFQATPKGEGVCLVQATQRYEDLFQRWGLLHPVLVTCG
jgi:DNA-directed RNA polymerase specialized sigma24 family protein